MDPHFATQTPSASARAQRLLQQLVEPQQYRTQQAVLPQFTTEHSEAPPCEKVPGTPSAEATSGNLCSAGHTPLATFSIPAPQNFHSPPADCEKYWPAPDMSAEMPCPVTVHPEVDVLLPNLATMATDWAIKLSKTKVFIVTKVPSKPVPHRGCSKLALLEPKRRRTLNPSFCSMTWVYVGLRAIRRSLDSGRMIRRIRVDNRNVWPKYGGHLPTPPPRGRPTFHPATHKERWDQVKTRSARSSHLHWYLSLKTYINAHRSHPQLNPSPPKTLPQHLGTLLWISTTIVKY